MQRFMGMMPSSYIEINKDFRSASGLKVHIDAGPEGWTVIYADGSTNYEDNVATAQENYERAYAVASERLELTPIDIQHMEYYNDSKIKMLIP